MTSLEIKDIRGPLTRTAFSMHLTKIASNLLPNEPSAVMIEGWEQGRRRPTAWAIYLIKEYKKSLTK